MWSADFVILVLVCLAATHVVGTGGLVAMSRFLVTAARTVVSFRAIVPVRPAVVDVGVAFSNWLSLTGTAIVATRTIGMLLLLA